MNQESKLKMEEAAMRAWEQDQKTNPSPVNPHAYVYGYKAGAQTMLDNPSDFGLVEKRLVDAGVLLRIETIKTCEETHLQNEKYRKALEHLERFTSDNPDYEFINHRLKEALKHNEQ